MEKTLIEQVDSFYNMKEFTDKNKTVTTKQSKIKDIMNILKNHENVLFQQIKQTHLSQLK